MMLDIVPETTRITEFPIAQRTTRFFSVISSQRMLPDDVSRPLTIALGFQFFSQKPVIDNDPVSTDLPQARYPSNRLVIIYTLGVEICPYLSGSRMAATPNVRNI